MNDDDLTDALEAWAAATDPAPDPITAAEVARADDGTVIRVRRPRRWLAVAAVVAVAGVTVAVAVAIAQPDDRTPDVVTSGGEEDGGGPRTQVVVVADLTDVGAQAHRFTIEAACPARASCVPTEPRAAGPLLPGTSLVADVPLGDGPWTFRYDAEDCADPCGPIDETGALVAGGDHAVSCSVDLPVAADPRRVVIRVTDPGEGRPICPLDPTGAEPVLTVPPAWSVRAPLPWTCGTGARDAGLMTGPSDPDAQAEALTCFADAVERRTPVELPTSLGTVGPTDVPRESMWRVGSEGPGGRAIEILSVVGGRGRPWSRMWCGTIDVRPVRHEVMDETPPGGPPGPSVSLGTWVEAFVDDCTEEEPLPLDLPPLDEAPPAATTTPVATTLPLPDTAPAGPGTVDLVVDAHELPMWVEGVERRWVLSVAGGAGLGEGLVEEPGSPPEVEGGTADVSLVARGIAVPAGKALLLTLEEYDCFSGGCSALHGFPGAPEMEDVPPASTCATEVPPADQARVIVLTLRGETCTADLAGALPPLTVPVAWTLRPPADEVCAGYPDEPEDFQLADIQRHRATCVLDALAAGTPVVEMPGFGERGDATLRVEDGVVTLFSPPGVDAGRAWSIEVCAAVVEGEDGRLEPQGCTDQPTGL